MNELDKVILEEEDFTEEEKQQLIQEEKEENFLNERYIEKWKTQFPEMGMKDLAEILDLTIKQDEINKLITFFGMLTAFTEDSQVNISFNAPSSTGKSYIPLEIAKLFPTENILEIGYCTPTAFFHDTGKFSPKMKGYEVNLSRKILIFLDQPHTELLQRLRPLLSHDEKELTLKITDKTKKYSLKTKNIFLIGYPVVIFCTAGLKMDEQETTRVILLSPEITEEKLKQAVKMSISKTTNKNDFQNDVNNNPDRKNLIERIKIIKLANIKDVKVDEKPITHYFCNKKLKPKNMRDVNKLVSVIKGIVLLNFMHREINFTERIVIANQKDIETGISLWKEIDIYQDYGIPPYTYNFYKTIIIPAYQEKVNKQEGLSIEEILKKHYELKTTGLADWKLRKEILKTLEIAGLIREDRDPKEKRKSVYFPIQEQEIIETGVGTKIEKNLEIPCETRQETTFRPIINENKISQNLTNNFYCLGYYWRKYKEKGQENVFWQVISGLTGNHIGSVKDTMLIPLEEVYRIENHFYLLHYKEMKNE